MQLKIQYTIPEAFFSTDAKGMHALLGGPTLFILGGNRTPALFISVLLHGNETSGLIGMQRLLKQAQFASNRPSLLLFVGNTQAAALGLRHLPGEADFNRIWDFNHDGPQSSVARELFQVLKTHKILAAVDLHNNSGKNPPFACLAHLTNETQALAREFSQRILHFANASSTLVYAMNVFCPAVALECSLPGDEQALLLLGQFLERLIKLDSLQALVSAPRPGLIHDIKAKIVLETETLLMLDKNIEEYNFKLTPPDSVWATMTNDKDQLGLKVITQKGEDVTAHYFKKSGRNVINICPVLPAMLTKNMMIAHSDCLGYLLN